MQKNIHYPNTNIKIKPGDVIYSSIGRSTYFVGHSVVVGTDYKIKEVIPTKPARYELDVIRFWARHRRGDQLTILRSYQGAAEAAAWITNNLQQFERYTIFNYYLGDFQNSYCYKFVAQAYYYGANISIVDKPNRLLLPNDILKSKALYKLAVIRI